MWRLLLALVFIASLVVPLVAPQQVTAFDLPWEGQPSWEPIIEGNSVFVDNELVHMEVTPHTLRSSGWVTFTFHVKQKGKPGNYDVVWGFDGIYNVKPIETQGKDYWETNFRDTGKYFENDTHYGWGVNKWKSQKAPSFVSKGYPQKVKCWIDLPFDPEGVQGKYVVGIKPSGMSVGEADSKGLLYIVDPWYNINWPYRKSFTVNNAGADLTDYQIDIDVNEGAGVDAGSSVYLNGNSANWPDDIRFANSTGDTLVDFWIEENDANDGTWWVELDSIPSGNNTFYIYYGNAGAPDVSSGADTFIVFDDFEWGINGDAITDSGGSVTWTINSGDSDISTDQAYGGTRSQKLLDDVGRTISTCPVTTSDDIAIRMRVYRVDAATYFTLGHGDGVERTTWGNNSSNDIKYYDGAWQDTGDNSSNTTWELYETYDFDWVAHTYDMAVAGVENADDADMRVEAICVDKAALFGDTAVGNDVWVDDFLVRNYREANTPVITAWGSEEQSANVETWRSDNVTATSASLRGNIYSLGGSAFINRRGAVWDTTSQGDPGAVAPSASGYSSNWTATGGWAAVPIDYYAFATGLTPGVLYYYRACTEDDAGTWAYGEEETFLSRPEPPTNFTAVGKSYGSLELSWTEGLGSNNVIITASDIAYPTTPWEGSFIGIFPGTGANITGLDLDTSYLLSAWSTVTVNPTQYSDSYVSINGTTQAIVSLLPNYSYYTPVTITSSCSTNQTGLRVPFVINSAALQASGYILNNWHDILLVDGQTAVLPFTASDLSATNLHVEGTATEDGGLGWLVDDVNLIQANGYWNGCTIEITSAGGLAPEDETSTVTGFTQVTSNVTFSANLTAVVESGDSYMIDNYRSSWFTNLDFGPFEEKLLRLYSGYAISDNRTQGLMTYTGDNVTVPDHSTLDVTDNITVACDIRFFALPSSNVTFISKQGAYEIGLDTAQQFYWTIWDGAVRRTATDTTTTVATGNNYRVRGTYKSGANNLVLYTNELPTDNVTYAGNVDSVAANVNIGILDSASIDRVWIGSLDVNNPTWVLQLDMESDQIGEASISDQSGYGNNAGLSWDITIPTCVVVATAGVVATGSSSGPGSAATDPPTVFPLPTAPTNWFGTRMDTAYVPGIAASSDCNDLPVFELVMAAADLLEWSPCTVYKIMAVFTSIGLAVGVGIATGSVLLTGVAGGIVLAMAAGSSLIGWWFLFIWGLAVMGYAISARTL